jgi:hypothetical protein
MNSVDVEVAYFRIMFGISLERQDIKNFSSVFWQRHVSVRADIMSTLPCLVMNPKEPQVTYLYLTTNVFILSKRINDM